MGEGGPSGMLARSSFYTLSYIKNLPASGKSVQQRTNWIESLFCANTAAHPKTITLLEF